MTRSLGWLVGFAVLASGGPLAAQEAALRPQVSSAVRAISRPLRDIAPEVGIKSPRPAAPLRNVMPPGADAARIDPVAQTSAGSLVSTVEGINIAGLGDGDYGYSVSSAPPDTVGAVGATQYVQWVNTSLAVFDKTTGNLVAGPIPGRDIFAPLAPNACGTRNDGDPIVNYDRLANRWVLSQFAIAGPYYQCVAVSATADATGEYFLYAFQQPSFNDYPKVGVWPDAYYATFNQFGTPQGARICAFERAKMLVGEPASQVCFQLSTFSLLPADFEGTTLPPAGSPNYLLNFGTNRLNLWKFSVNFANPNLSTFTGPTAISVAPFTAAPNSGVVPQPATLQRLDAIGDRLLFRLAYRNRGGVESLLVNHSVSVNNTVGVRWYELRLAGGNATLFQQGTFTPDSTYRWMGSIAMDKVGNIALGYSASSRTVFPSVRYTGRTPSDPLGTLQAENVIQVGSGSQTLGLSRWGDYSAMTIDPVDDCTFWFTTEYMRERGTFNWSTRIASFKFPSCQ